MRGKGIFGEVRGIRTGYMPTSWFLLRTYFKKIDLTQLKEHVLSPSNTTVGITATNALCLLSTPMYAPACVSCPGALRSCNCGGGCGEPSRSSFGAEDFVPRQPSADGRESSLPRPRSRLGAPHIQWLGDTGHKDLAHSPRLRTLVQL